MIGVDAMTTKTNLRKKLTSAFFALLVAALGAMPYLLFKDRIQSMAGLGYAGLFAACLLTNASVCLPASGIAFTVAASTALNPLLCAVLGGLGSATGEVVGYALGYFGRNTVTDSQLFARAEAGIRRYGYLAVLAFSFLPLPVFDLIGIAAGTAKLSLARFYPVCCLGKILKMLLYVFVLRTYLPL